MANSTRTLAIVVGLIFIIVGAILFMITEPAGAPGTGASGGTAEVSEDVRPYLLPAILLLVVGVVVLALGALMKP